VVFRGLTVAVVIPAFNEADKIQATLGSIPDFVDDVVVVDDGSRDATVDRARAAAGAMTVRHAEVVIHPHNRGVGAALATGYARAADLGADLVAVMAGDGQMHPADLPALLDPVVDGRADYAKGNRLLWPGGWRQFPVVRLGGTVALSALTRLATGYRDVSDAQCGYTVIARPMLLAVDARRLYPRYGYPNHLLGRLAELGARVVDVPVRPVYGDTWRSGLRPSQVALPLSRILSAMFARRVVRALRGPKLHRAQPPCGSAS
jgi:glycosyltransferase involved in cell wall biosynthesis